MLSIYRHAGIRGVYAGYIAQLLRECPGNVIYFGSYTGSRDLLPASLSDTYERRARAHALALARAPARFRAGGGGAVADQPP